MIDAPSGVRLDRRALLAGGVAVAAGLAGCGDSDGQRADPGDPLEYVPASASVVIGVDMALTDSEATNQLLEAYADEEGILERFERRTGLEPEQVDDILAFSEDSASDDRTFVAEADVDESEARSAAEERTGADYESVDFENGAVYRPADGDGPAVGTAAEGQYVVGPEASVKTALDVFQGDAESLGDPLRSVFEDAREGQGDGAVSDGGSDGGTGNGTNGTGDGTRNGTDTGGGGSASGLTQYAASATDSPREYLPPEDSERVPGGVSLDLYEELDTATATYATGGGDVAVDIVLRAPDADVAQQVAEFTRTVLMYLRSQVDPEVGAQLNRVEVERSEAVVTVSYRSPVEDAVTLAEWVADLTTQ